MLLTSYEIERSRTRTTTTYIIREAQMENTAHIYFVGGSAASGQAVRRMDKCPSAFTKEKKEGEKKQAEKGNFSSSKAVQFFRLNRGSRGCAARWRGTR